jgi:hypothetical protein
MRQLDMDFINFLKVAFEFGGFLFDVLAGVIGQTHVSGLNIDFARHGNLLKL